jgi:hypothetical protein
LSAFFHGFRGEGFIVQARQHDQRDSGGYGARAPHGFETMPVRKPQVQQDYVDSTFRKQDQGLTQAQDMGQLETARSLLPKHLAKQKSVSRVILHQKHLQWLFFHEGVPRGSLTTDSQKLSILWTTLRKPSRSTGLLM